MAIIVERKFGHNSTARGDVRFRPDRPTVAFSGPEEGDAWYDNTTRRIFLRNPGSIRGGFGSRYGDTFGPIGSTAISSGAITVTVGHIDVQTEAAAATDDLDDITAPSDMRDGDLILLRNVVGGQTVTVRNNGGGTGNIRLNGGASRVLDTANDILILMFVSATSLFVEASFSSNPA